MQLHAPFDTFVWGYKDALIAADGLRTSAGIYGERRQAHCSRLLTGQSGASPYTHDGPGQQIRLQTRARVAVTNLEK